MLGFTQKEQGVLLFLVCGLVIGLGVQWLRQHGKPIHTLPLRTIAKSAAPDTAVARSSRHSMPHSRGTVSSVSINDAGLESLQRIPGVGPVLARRIVEYRQTVGRFNRADDLLAVRGIGPRMLQRMKPYITCE
jgi:competence protein ComEA